MRISGSFSFNLTKYPWFSKCELIAVYSYVLWNQDRTINRYIIQVNMTYNRIAYCQVISINRWKGNRALWHFKTNHPNNCWSDFAQEWSLQSQTIHSYSYKRPLLHDKLYVIYDSKLRLISLWYSWKKCKCSAYRTE